MKSFVKAACISCFLAATAVLSGCASIIHGTNQKFDIESQPNHANIKLDNAYIGKTPKQIKLSREKEHMLTISLAGYQPETIALKHTISGWFFGNLLIGGIIGIAVDGIDGAIYNLTPEEISQHGQQQGRRFTAKKHTITVFLVKRANKRWKKIGQLKKLR